MDGESDFIVLEDASCLGFGPASRQNCLDWSECAMIVTTMAKFHAISFAYRDQKEEEFIKIASCIRETYMSRDHWSWYKRLHVRISNCLVAFQIFALCVDAIGIFKITIV